MLSTRLGMKGMLFPVVVGSGSLSEQSSPKNLEPTCVADWDEGARPNDTQRVGSSHQMQDLQSTSLPGIQRSRKRFV